MSTKLDYSKLNQDELAHVLNAFLSCVTYENVSKEDLLITIDNLRKIGFDLDTFYVAVDAYCETDEFQNRLVENEYKKNRYEYQDFEIP